MTLVVGKVQNAIGEPLPGSLEIAVSENIQDRNSSPIALRVAPVTIGCENGAFEIDLTPSETSYQFRYFTTEIIVTYLKYADQRLYRGAVHEHEGQWYSGETHTLDSELLIRLENVTETDVIAPFHATIPDRDRVEFADLTPTGITASNQDTSLLTLAILLTTRPEFLTPLAQEIANIQAD